MMQNDYSSSSGIGGGFNGLRKSQSSTLPAFLAGIAFAGLGYWVYRSLGSRMGWVGGGGGGLAKILPLRGAPKTDATQSKNMSTETKEEKKFRNGTADVVEEASMESFPASDSPAW